MTISVLPETTILFLLLFARIGALVMLMPGVGEQSIPTRVRLTLALALTLVLYPLISASLPQGLSGDLPRLLVTLILEVLIGVGLGLLARLLLSVTQVAGALIATTIGLGFAQTMDPTMGQQGAIVGSFLAVTGITLIFMMNLHHLAIIGIADSYSMFPPGAGIPIADMRDAVVMTIAEAFRIGVQVAAPFMVFGLVFNLGLGVLAKLMPQLQVFFIAMPVSIAIGLMLLALLLGTMMSWYLGHVEQGLMRFIVR